MGIMETRESYMFKVFAMFAMFTMLEVVEVVQVVEIITIKCYQICRLTVFAAWYLRHFAQQQQLVFQ